MKKLITVTLLSCLVSMQGIQIVVAETALPPPNGTSTPPGIDLSTLDYRYNAVIEFFLQKLGEKDFQTAYSYMAGNFPNRHDLGDFTSIVTQAGLTDFTAKKWLSYKDEMKEIGVTTLVGEFTTPDQVVHTITFYFIIGGETEIKIGDFTESVTVADLTRRIPEAAVWQKIVHKDLKMVTTGIKRNLYKKVYKYLSRGAQQRMALADMKKAFRAFKKQKLNTDLPGQGVIVITENFPQISADGLMVIQGKYENKTHVVNFALAYDYEEWKWKLGVFSLNAVRITSQR